MSNFTLINKLTFLPGQLYQVHFIGPAIAQTIVSNKKMLFFSKNGCKPVFNGEILLFIGYQYFKDKGSVRVFLYENDLMTENAMAADEPENCYRLFSQ